MSLSTQTYYFFLPSLPISTIWAGTTLSLLVCLKVQCRAMSCLAEGNLRLLLPNRVVSPTPSLYCHYLPCTCTTHVASGWIISSLFWRRTSTIAMKGAWQTISDGSFRHNCIFHSSERKIYPYPFLPTCCSFPVLFQSLLSWSNRQTMQLTSLLFKSEAKWSRPTVKSTICPRSSSSAEKQMPK